jgi:hypothetical protein
LSTDRNCTSVCPSLETGTVVPAVGPTQLTPPVVDVSYSYLRIPLPVSVLPAADTVTGALVCQVADPPVTVGTVGFDRSILTVLTAVGATGAQSDVFPALSSDRTCT